MIAARGDEGEHKVRPYDDWAGIAMIGHCWGIVGGTHVFARTDWERRGLFISEGDEGEHKVRPYDDCHDGDDRALLGRCWGEHEVRPQCDTMRTQ